MGELQTEVLFFRATKSLKEALQRRAQRYGLTLANMIKSDLAHLVVEEDQPRQMTDDTEPYRVTDASGRWEKEPTNG